MQLFEALRVIRDRNRGDEPPHTVGLVCGITPLHLRTFLTAEIALRRERGCGPVDLKSGLFGDLLGNLESAETAACDAAVVVMEWSDLDPRLGWRSTGGWRNDRMADVLASARLRIVALEAAIHRLAQHMRVVVSLPTLPLPPASHRPPGYADVNVMILHACLADLAVALSRDPGVRLSDAGALAEISPPGTRHDVTSDLWSGFPYQLNHASVLANQLAELLHPRPALKGLITDLDNTLWAGIIGDDGIDAVTWSLDDNTYHHALYQELLASLAESGVLLAVASRNEQSIVDRALQRRDLAVPPESFYPIVGAWQAKSASVASILTAWNIGPSDVLFIDDSPLELAEVGTAFPEINRRQFPQEPAEVVALLGELRTLFGRSTVSDEDRLRLSSLRSAVPSAAIEVNPDTFLAQADAELRLTWNSPSERCFQLINKTNQFNLNGHRLSESDWRRRTDEPDCLLLAVAYEDKFGPLGTISVVLGRRLVGSSPPDLKSVEIDAWVLSCRAFSRRIEHATLKAIFDQTGAQRLVFKFASTDRNVPLQNLLTSLNGHRPIDGRVTLDRDEFQTNCPNLFARIIDDAPSGCAVAA